MKLALFTVAYGGLWYDGEALSLKDQILKAKELGFEGLSIEAKRPVASPLDLDRKAREEIKEYADSQGIDICAIESMSNFASPVMEQRENNLAMMRDILEMARDLDVDIVKVFAAWSGVKWDGGGVAEYKSFNVPGKSMDKEDVQKWARVRKGIREVAEWAEDIGITLALQNHPPVLSPGYEDVLSMVKEIGMDNVKLCLDVPLFYERQSDEYIKEAVEKCGDLIKLSHYGAWNFEEKENGEVLQTPYESAGKPVNYEAWIRELKRIGYDGYLAQELCLPVIENHEIQGIEAADRENKLAARYMKNLIAET
ncbi:hypothetical protein AKJ57_00805 [candidate division MSBL1 archaeon SCGC-AAA259A05]|uniref:Xylose isomerase-like TIM barrel domain-containing protein n=1 Tax=candidate division MSBL1 archaeon SCGC-AAA259A05 TaxID=1698259 RepID=A0A133UBP0_9EURY|nr:hypothetical protein AKJ57_00805 [candidate division MSBL1 archaeon SCGC-AAA259A05]